MVCAKCGLNSIEGAQFCRRCGAPMAVVAAPAGWTPNAYVGVVPYLRVRQNLQPLGLMWCIYGAYRLVTVLLATMMLHSLAVGGMFGALPDGILRSIHAAMPLIVGMTVVMSVAAMAVGYGLLTRQPWARVLAIVFGILALLKIPFGTALGIYTLWVLAPASSGAEWDEITGAAAASPGR